MRFMRICDKYNEYNVSASSDCLPDSDDVNL